MQLRLPDGLSAPGDARPHRVVTQGPPSLAEVLVRRSTEAREEKRDALLVEVLRTVEAFVLATDRGGGGFVTFTEQAWLQAGAATAPPMPAP